MELKDIIDYIFQYGVGFICLAYLIYFNLTTSKEMTKTIQEVVISLTRMNEKLEDIERKLGDKNVK